jgi:hypothetical protein
MTASVDPQYWIATRGIDPVVVLERFALLPASRQAGATPFAGESVAGAVLNGWFLLAFGPQDLPLLEDQRIARVSRRGEALVVRRVPGSDISVARWFAGQPSWSLIHRAAEGAAHLEVMGPDDPPVYLAYLRKLAWREVNEGKPDAMRGVPMRVQRDETGFDPDQPLVHTIRLGLVAPAGRAEALAAAEPPPKPFWKIW